MLKQVQGDVTLDYLCFITGITIANKKSSLEYTNEDFFIGRETGLQLLYINTGYFTVQTYWCIGYHVDAFVMPLVVNL